MKFPLLLTLLITLAPVPASALITDAMRKELYKPVQVVLSSGRTIKGICSNFKQDGFTMTRYIDGGELEFNIKTSEIESITFPGKEIEQFLLQLIKNKQPAEALELYKILFVQRSAYFRYLPERDVHFFLPYVKIALDQSNPSLTIAIAQNIVPFIKAPQATEFLRDSILVAYYKLGLPEKTIELSKAWLQNAQRYHSSAVGWWIFAESKYKQDDFIGARWVSLYPIVFSSQVPMTDLNRCYVIAIASATALEDHGQAATLRAEMKQRKIPWPEDMPEFDFIKNEIPDSQAITKTAPIAKVPKKTIHEIKKERNTDLPTKTF